MKLIELIKEKYGSYCPWHYTPIKKGDKDWDLGTRQCGVKMKRKTVKVANKYEIRQYYF